MSRPGHGSLHRNARPPVAARRTKRPRIGRRALIVWGCLVAAISIVATVGMLRIYPPPELVAIDAALQPAGNGPRPYVRILATEANRRFLASTGGDYDRHIEMWRLAYREAGADVEIVATPDAWLASIDSGEGALLVAPYLLCAGDEEVRSLARGVDAGGGIVLSGPFAARDADGSWAGWQRMHGVLGSREARELSPDQSMFMTVRAESPLGRMGLAGARFALHKRESQWGLQGLPGTAYWSDFNRAPVPDQDGAWASLCLATRGAGRIAWLGFEADLIAPERGDEARALMASLVSFCSGEPLAAIDSWPRGRDAVLLICEDTEEEFANAAHLERILSDRGVRGTFMCVSDLARRHAGLVERIARRHEVGSHSDNHRPFDGQSLRRQIARLRRSAADLQKITGRPALGFRPPEEGHDDQTLRALAGAGYLYTLGNLAAARPLPEILRFRASDGDLRLLVRVPRIQVDDYELLARDELSGPEILERLRIDLDRARDLRGVDFVSIHSHILGRPDRIGVVAEFLDSIDREGLWITGADSLAHWWKSRDQLEVLPRTMPDRIAIAVRNGGAEPLAGAVLTVVPPGNPAAVELGGALQGSAEVSADGSVQVPLPALAAGEAIEVWMRPAERGREDLAHIR